MAKPFTAENVESSLAGIRKAVVMAATPDTLWSRQDRRTRAHLLNTVVSLSCQEQAMINAVANSRKQKWSVSPNQKRKKITFEGSPQESLTGSNRAGCGQAPLQENMFLTPPSKETIENCIINFIDKTSNEAVARVTCGICAADGFKRERKEVDLDDLPNKDILHPKSFHKAHSLTEGMLLEESGIVMSGNSKRIQVCSGCECELKLGRVLKQALANGMWIGKVPMELAVLTLPKRVLVARCFPAAYIVKLFPKQKGTKTWASAGCNSGMRGNVSTYHLNMEDIANLVDPIMMPPSPAVLEAMIGITIIGPHNLPE